MSCEIDTDLPPALPRGLSVAAGELAKAELALERLVVAKELSAPEPHNRVRRAKETYWAELQRAARAG